ncbi:mechanosensitive ion channel family protein [Spongiimicrobium salis]|uniref:mechanosensitive ion channel family protein n=1 Tax=Spongiimicrobium salis TaxID=1667022 RepID=UPI00374CBCD4
MNTEIRHFLRDLFMEWGMSENIANYLNLFLLFVAALLLVLLLDFVVWKILRALSFRLAKRTKTDFDNFLVNNKAPRYLAHVFPLLAIFEFIPIVFVDFPYIGGIILKLAQIVAVIVTLQIAKSLLRSIHDYLKTKQRYKDKPIDSYIQVFMIFAWITGILAVFAIVTNISIWKFFTGLGAASAVILLIFKDSILGLVASIQISINDMVRIGDWITFQKYGADGDVIEINLATVKVQNFDMTITTIPTYALISDSFKNWRGMNQSGGRRIKRSLIIKQRNIKFLKQEDIEALKKIELLAPYLDTRSNKIIAYNTENNIDKEILINGKNLTNIGVFRKYVESYLENHSALNKDMTMMTRQLSPTPQGIPLEIYAFSADKRWQNYEYILADIFDHLLAAVPYFDLEIFELPSSIPAR